MSARRRSLLLIALVGAFGAGALAPTTLNVLRNERARDSGAPLSTASIPRTPAPTRPGGDDTRAAAAGAKNPARADNAPGQPLGPVQATTSLPATPAPQPFASLFPLPPDVTPPDGALAFATPATPTAPRPDVSLLPPLPPAPDFDVAGVREAVEAYRAGDLAKGDAAAKAIADPVNRLAVEWAALRLQPRPAGYARIVAFLAANPDWPMADWLRARAEQALHADLASAATIRKHFATFKPVSPNGKLLAARLAVLDGRKDEARAVVAALWREGDLGEWLEGALLKEFGALLTADDHRARADRLFYREQHQASLRAAALVGPVTAAPAAAEKPAAEKPAGDKPAAEKPAAAQPVAATPAADKRHAGKHVADKHPAGKRTASKAKASPDKPSNDFLAFAQARLAVMKGASADKAGARIVAALKKDPTWLYAQIAGLRRAKKLKDAGDLLAKAPPAPSGQIGADEWWVERRILSRARLDDGDAAGAYAIAAQHGLERGASFVEAEFQAGWIALRFADKTDLALGHFTRAYDAATTPMSRARAAYWQARAIERSDKPDDATTFFTRAAQYSSSYYGQLARARLGLRDLPVRVAQRVAQGDERLPAIRVIERLDAVGAKDVALGLTVGLARGDADETQIAALAKVLTQAQDARALLTLGKLAAQRGLELDDVAYPIFGVPDYAPLANSAEKPVVYAIARQESAFQPDAISHAGARGLMQMLPSTAKRTADRAGVAFDATRLTTDPAFNAQLGAAHLGDLMGEHPGSLILVFAAYNAGGHRVKQWIAAYGDPRTPGVDPIDWVERIPFTETRNYVQRVTENLGVYRARFGRADMPSLPVKDLRAEVARR